MNNTELNLRLYGSDWEKRIEKKMKRNKLRKLGILVLFTLAMVVILPLHILEFYIIKPIKNLWNR